ncbi:MAG TPA: DUF4349 domain-containing protein [Ginsengibacter sp.]
MKKIISLVLICTLLFSCDRFSKDKEDKSVDKDISLLQAPPSNAKELLPKEINSDTSTTSNENILQGTLPGQNPDWDKKIIKTADLKLEVKDFKSYNKIVHNDSKRYGAYIAREDQSESNEKKETTISIKVPVDQFENLLNELPSDSDKIIEKKITSEDVTGEVVDTKSRLQTKEEMRLKYLEFLKQAKNMGDVLKVQGEINNIQEEMESASTRINYLLHQSAYSTINLTFYQPIAGYNPPDDSPGFSTRTMMAFKNGFQFIAEIFIGFISIWPLWLLAFIVWIIYKKHSLRAIPAKQKQ